ncbi:Hypothetical protein (plasmid) [Pseudomonas putida]|nr:Hypothetical protein [Pseudomonas putida]
MVAYEDRQHAYSFKLLRETKKLMRHYGLDLLRGQSLEVQSFDFSNGTCSSVGGFSIDYVSHDKASLPPDHGEFLGSTRGWSRVNFEQ